ncbi:hypothetical protein ACH5RR_034982 [Cinchona calisaya]|uniref:Zinc finger PMZ-type domain-containing protein n=1 Tax=Cinchona calisaya TaxID=153742 RepID=A0ABD2YDU2_9GENT
MSIGDKELNHQAPPHYDIRTKRKAVDLIQGNEKDQYEKLWDYMHEVLRVNPGSTMLMQMVDGFQALFGVDGTFLKGPCREVLLIAVGMDSNNARFKGMALRGVLWAVAKVVTPAQFASTMEEMAKMDLDAAKWFDDKLAARWNRSHFSTFPGCDVLLNNICESFNSKILHAREMSIIVGCPAGDQFLANLNDKTCAWTKWDLTRIPCPHAIAAIWMDMGEPLDYVDICYTVETYFKCYRGVVFPINGEIDWT